MKHRSYSWITVTFALLTSHAAGCGSSEPRGFVGDPATLSGQIMGYTNGPGYTLEASLYGLYDPIATAPIDAAGHFSITLPTLAEVRDRIPRVDALHGTPPGCTGSIWTSSAQYGMRRVLFGAVV